ncbi:hypothetical protein METP3_03352 [Methanosarcinales archaeon]|nr:hypothetical protein METP3_03352 [Methanosarcinales archaeon]
MIYMKFKHILTSAVFILILFANVDLVSAAGTSYHVSSDGTREFTRIQDAANVAKPGDTIVVHGGVYRERVTPPRGGTDEATRITYMAAPGETVYIKGSDIWSPDWISSGNNIYHALPADSMFTDDVYRKVTAKDGSTFINEDKNPFKVTLFGYQTAQPLGVKTLGQVFVDGEQYNERDVDIAPGVFASTIKTWYYNSANGHIYIHFPDNNPSSHIVEITTRRSIFRPHIQGLGYITVSGFIMEHCGNNNQFARYEMGSKSAGRTHHAALDARGGHHWIIENNTVRYAKSQGIDAGGYSNNDNERNPSGQKDGSYNIVRNNIVNFNGLLGIGMSMAYNGQGKGGEISGNWVEGNNALGTGIHEDGGIKTHQFHNSIIADNVVINTRRGAGIWTDYEWYNSRITRNLLSGNQEAGIYVELGVSPEGQELLIDNNVLFDNLQLANAQGVTITQNYLKNIYNTAWSVNTRYLGNTDIIATNGRYKITNNLIQGSTIDKSRMFLTNRIENNVMGVPFSSNIADNTIIGTISVNNDPFNNAANLVSSKITNDYFNSGYGSTKIIGPFQDLLGGKKTYTLWPKSTQERDTPVQERDTPVQERDTPVVLSSITVSPSTVSMAIGDTRTFTAYPKDQFGDPVTTDITWTISNPSVGTITPSGIFTALAEGTTTITAKNGSVSGNAIVIIRLSTSDIKNIENQGFESGTTSWQFFTDGIGAFSTVSPGYEGTNAANIILGSSGSNIQLYQYGITLEQNTAYRLSFSAYSTNGNDLKVKLFKHDSPYTNYGLDFTADLGTSWSTFTTEFTTAGFSGAVNDARLQFWLAPFVASAETYYIDDIRLEKVSLPNITTHPSDQGVDIGQTATFSVIATDSESLTYQWKKNGEDIPGAISASYTTPSTILSDNGSIFSVKVTNSVGSITSNNAILIVKSKNLIANSMFESDTSLWSFYTTGRGSFTVESPDNEVTKSGKIVLENSASNIQLYQEDISLEPNTLYRLSFDAYSNAGDDISVRLFKHDPPYTNYGLDLTADLSTNWQTFTTEFTTAGFIDTVNDARLMFWFAPFAAAGDTYYINYVKLEKIKG